MGIRGITAPHVVGNLVLLLGLCLLPPLLGSFFRVEPNPKEAVILWLTASLTVAIGLWIVTNARNKRNLAILIITLILASGAMAFFEVGLRLLIKQDEALLIYRPAPDREDSFRLKSDLHISTRIAGKPVSIYTSSDGLRITENEQISEAGTNQIVFLGDSFTFGLWAQSAEKSFVHRVEEQLREFNVNAINLGVPGYGLDDSRLQLVDLWQKLTPDIVVLCIYNGNDFLDTYLGTTRYIVRDDGLLELDKRVIKKLIPASYRGHDLGLEAWLGKHSYLFRVAGRLLKELSGANEKGDSPPTSLPIYSGFQSDVFWSQVEPPPFAQDAITTTLASLQALIEYCKTEKHVPILIVSIPYKEQVTIPEKFTGKYSVEKPQSMIAEVAERNSIPFLDLQPVFEHVYNEKQTPLYYYFDGHFNDAGHAVAADAIASFIKKNMF